MAIVELDSSPEDIAWVLSVMFFPSDQAARHRYFAARRAHAELQDAKETDPQKLDAATLRLLIEAPPLADLTIQTVEATKRAIVAGNILCTLFLMHTFDLEEPSMRKAIFVAREYAKQPDVMYGDGSKMDTSEPMLRKHWTHFRPVAHLWAALQIDQAYSFTDGERNVFAPEVFPTFLGVAATMFEFGVSFVPFRAKLHVPILDPSNCWTLPESVYPLSLTEAPPPDILMRTLKEYSAPRSTA